MKARTRSKSDSTIQREAESMALSKFGGKLGKVLKTKTIILGKSKIQLDGYYESQDSVVVAEIFSHIGPCKGGQIHKVHSDILKLYLFKECYKERMPFARIVCYLVFLDRQCSAILQGNSWAAEAAKRIGIKCCVIKISPKWLDRIREAQLRQDIRDKPSGSGATPTM